LTSNAIEAAGDPDASIDGEAGAPGDAGDAEAAVEGLDEDEAAGPHAAIEKRARTAMVRYRSIPPSLPQKPRSVHDR
jgi:hypothetical protein